MKDKPQSRRVLLAEKKLELCKKQGDLIDQANGIIALWNSDARIEMQEEIEMYKDIVSRRGLTPKEKRRVEYLKITFKRDFLDPMTHCRVNIEPQIGELERDIAKVSSEIQAEKVAEENARIRGQIFAANAKEIIAKEFAKKKMHASIRNSLRESKEFIHKNPGHFDDPRVKKTLNLILSSLELIPEFACMARVPQGCLIVAIIETGKLIKAVADVRDAEFEIDSFVDFSITLFRLELPLWVNISLDRVDFIVDQVKSIERDQQSKKSGLVR